MREKILRVGVYGVKRGSTHIKSIAFLDNAQVVAICDRDEGAVEKVKKFCPSDVVICPDYDTLLEQDLDLVVLANFLPDHAGCAIQALRKGINVVSECLAAVTMKECVDLVEAVEETGKYYSMAENTPWGTSCLELRRLYSGGTLGELSYAEAEYSHPMAPEDVVKVRPTADHWRNFMPKTYYLSHPLGGLMNITGLLPKKVLAKVTPDYTYAKKRGFPHADSGAILLVEMEGGVLFRVTGCAHFGAPSGGMRLACTNADAELIRHQKQRVSLTFAPWELPKEMEHAGTHVEYYPPIEADVQAVISKGLSTSGHNVADFRCVRNYINEIAEGREPDMNVYRATAMSAVAILGWRSVLNNSQQIEIPDFRDPAARDQYRNDDLSPWRGEIPYYVFPAK